jgi:hypothetical protein
MTKAKSPASGGVKKKKVDGDYKKRRKSVPSEATLAKRSAAKEKALAAREKQKPKPKANAKPQPLPVKGGDGSTAPSCEPGFKMVWTSKDCAVSGCGYRIMHKKMMRYEQGRVRGHWLKLKVMKHNA